MSKPPRFFISPDQISGSEAVVAGDDIRHIGTVLRMKTGDELLLCDGEGTEYAAKIVRIERSGITTEITGRAKRDIPYPRVVLVQGLPKSDKMDFIVQKATELGVSGIIPLITERTVMKVKDREKRLTRWQKIAREAAMQSTRPDIPRVGPIQDFKEFLRTVNPEPRTLLLLPWEKGTEPVKNILRKHPSVKSIIVLIGPEGGLSQTEVDGAKTQGFAPVSLGPNILRTETAAIAVLGMIGYEFF